MKIVQQDLLRRKQFLKILWSEVWKGEDFNSCGKWSSRVLPVMLWWFPYFYSDCSWPYCASLHKWYDIWVFLGTCWMQLSNPLVGGRSFPKVVSATKWAGVFHVERSLAQFNSSWALNISRTYNYSSLTQDQVSNWVFLLLEKLEMFWHFEFMWSVCFNSRIMASRDNTSEVSRFFYII